MSSVVEMEKVMEDYGDYLLRVAYVYVKNQRTAEDIVQDVFIQYYQHSDQFRAESSLKTYLVRMTVNQSHDHLRSWAYKSMRLRHKVSKGSTHKTPENQLLAKETSGVVLKELLSLKVNYREVIVLYYYQELSTVDISEMLGCPESTVRTRLQRARAKLRERLKEQEGFSHGFD